MKTPDYQQWQRLWLETGCQGDSRPVYERLAHAYAETQRYYHTFQHLADCLEMFDAVRQLARQPLAVELAIWFHDAIYDPRSPDNEESSAVLAVDCLTVARADPKLVATVSRLVLATKRHDAGADPDAALIMDVDLAILGQWEVRFQEYEAQIRQEYAWVPAPIFAAKRAEILRQFLARERIYTTAVFHGKFESAARLNLARSIQKLETTAA